MGYTHYFNQLGSVKNDAWTKICDDADKIISYCQNNGIGITSNDENSALKVDKKAGWINFNGTGDNEHETFYITKKKSKIDSFNFCKTANKPYDLAVCSTLLIIYHHAGKNFDISSDGGPNDWKEAAELNFELFKYGFEMPQDIVKDDPIANHEIQTEFLEKINIQINKNSLEEHIESINKTKKTNKI